MLTNPGKSVRVLKIDKEFQGLIRPLFKNEYLQLEANLIQDGCREPISVWNGVIVDGHNRYRICTKHQIPFAIEEMEFASREEAIVWICENQLGRRNLTTESRKYLIGKQYESEKIISRRKAIYQQVPEDKEDLPYETFDPNSESRQVETKRKTAQRIAEDNHISHGTVEKYSIYAKAIEEVEKKEPQMAAKILSGRYKISHEGVLALAKRSPKEIQDLNRRLEQAQHPFAKYQTTRHEIQSMQPPAKKSDGKPVSVKDMPAYDPDAEVIGIALTIPSWTSSINRVAQSNLHDVSEPARDKLLQALFDLQDMITKMVDAIGEDY